MLSLSVGAITLSGIRAASHRINVSGDNLSRLPVPNSSQNRVVQSADAFGGVSTSVKNYPVDPEQATGIPYLSSNIDIATELIEQPQAALAYEASVAVYEMDNKLEKEILNIKA